MKMNAMTISKFKKGGFFSSFKATGETEELLKKLAGILDELKPQDVDNYHSIWISAPRPTFRQFYDFHYGYDCPFKEATEDILQNAEEAYETSYPDSKVFFRVGTKHFRIDEKKEFYALFINHRTIFTINDTNKTEELDGKELLLWAIDGAEHFVSALKDGKLRNLVSQVPYSCQYGRIQRKEYWNIVPQEKAEFLADYPEKEVKQFFLVFDEKRIVGTPIKNMTARKYYEACATVYRALGFTEKKPRFFEETEDEKKRYGKEHLTPREFYYAYADGRDNGMRTLPLDDAEAFTLWCNEKGPYYHFNGAHPWEIIPSFTVSLSMHLFPIRNQDGTYYFSLSGDSSLRAPETIIASNALASEDYPIRVCGFDTIKNRLLGQDCLSIQPKSDDDLKEDYIHLPDGKTGEAIIRQAEWDNSDYQLENK